MLYELILINEIEQRAKIIFLSVGVMVFINCMCYCPTPTLHLNLALTGDCAFLLSPQKTYSA